MKRKILFSVKEYAKQIHISERQVRRLIKDGRIRAQKVGRGYQIPVDQSKEVKPSRHFYVPGKSVVIPPIPPDGLIWDKEKNKLVSIGKYAKEHGYRLTSKNGKQLIDFPCTKELTGDG